MNQPIPVRNFYYLLTYAWDKLPEAKVVNVGADDYRHLADLFARVLANGLEHLLKRGLDRGYQEHHDVVAGVRGKIDFAASVKGHLFDRGRAACVFDELTHDVMHNRILRRTVRDLLQVRELNTGLRTGLETCAARMWGVSDVRLAPAVFARVQLHGNNGVYDFLLRVCRLIYDLAVVDERDGSRRFRDFERDERAMARLYERFLLRFYRREQREFKVYSETLDWADTEASAADRAYLPAMRTDVSLESPTRKVVIDAKYYRQPMQSNFGKDTVRSGHLYQLFAYLKNIGHRGGTRVEGILLYPQVDQPLELRYLIQGHVVRVTTVDLSQGWERIHDYLLNLLVPSRP